MNNDVFPTRNEGGKLGLWLFILSEVMLFGGILASYVLLRWGSSVCALGTPVWPQAGYSGGLGLATLNTLILITSSFTIVRAYLYIKEGNLAATSTNISITIFLGIIFLVIKGFEYAGKIQHGFYPQSDLMLAQPGLGIFVSFYYVLTGLHALHIVVGLIWLNALLFLSHKESPRPAYIRKLEYAGLYWHFVDILWVFLFPLFYLI